MTAVVLMPCFHHISEKNIATTMAEGMLTYCTLGRVLTDFFYPIVLYEKGTMKKKKTFTSLTSSEVIWG